MKCRESLPIELCVRSFFSSMFFSFFFFFLSLCSVWGKMYLSREVLHSQPCCCCLPSSSVLHERLHSHREPVRGDGLQCKTPPEHFASLQTHPDLVGPTGLIKSCSFCMEERDSEGKRWAGTSRIRFFLAWGLIWLLSMHVLICVPK